jgi:hypothetical protein
MKIQLTEKALLEIENINAKYGDEDSPLFDEWDNMSDEERLITDAELYATGCYIENIFHDLKTWCLELGQSEYIQEYLEQHPNAVYDKVQLMLEKEIIEIC